MTILRVVRVLPDISSSRGFVYVLERPDDDEKSEMLCKVGYTSVSASSRAREYTDGGWKVHYEVEMQDWLARLVERDLHKALERYWFDPAITGGTAKEVFMCSPEEAVTWLHEIKSQRIKHEIEELADSEIHTGMDEEGQEPQHDGVGQSKDDYNEVIEQLEALQEVVSQQVAQISALKTSGASKRARIKELEAIVEEQAAHIAKLETLAKRKRWR